MYMVCLLASGMAEPALTFSTWDFVIGAVLMAVLFIVGVVVAPWVRRKYHPSSVDGSYGRSSFDVDRLDRMRREGLITDEEFRLLRRAALGLDMTTVKADNSTSSAPTGGDDEESASKTADPGLEADADEDEPEKEL